MTTRFKQLFQIEVWHDYYDGPCRDFEFVIPSESADLLRNGRLVAKSGDGRLVVLFAMKDGTSPFATLAGKSLEFGLKLTNPHFPNFTQATGTDTRKEFTIPYFSNKTDASKLAKAEPGPVPPSLAAGSVFGIVSIQIAKEFYETRAEFRIDFAARKERLRYHVWLRKFSDAEMAALAITSKGGSPGAAPISFNKSAPEDTASFGRGTAPPKVIVFESTTEIPRRERADGALELRKNGEVLVPNLPRPSAAQPSADVFIHLNKP